jgi:hypothetical protein
MGLDLGELGRRVSSDDSPGGVRASVAPTRLLGALALIIFSSLVELILRNLLWVAIKSNKSRALVAKYLAEILPSLLAEPRV